MSEKMFTTGRAKAIEQLAKELETGYGAPYVIPTSENGTELDTLIGALADAAVVNPAASASMIALLKGIIKQLQGDGTGGKSAPVTMVGVEQTNGADAAAKSALVAGKTAAGKGVPLLVTDEGKVVTTGDSMVAAGKVSVPDLFDHAIETTGFNSISIINDGPAELVIAIDESSLDGTKLIHIGDSEAFSRNISGNDLHYSIANDACTFRYVLL